jgi:hypothetical protein
MEEDSRLLYVHTSSNKIFVLDSNERESFVGFRPSLLGSLAEHTTRIANIK